MEPSNPSDDLLSLTVNELKQMSARILVLPHKIRQSKSALIDYILTNASPDHIQSLKEVATAKRSTSTNTISKKRKRVEAQHIRRTRARLDENDVADLSKFMALPSPSEIQQCYEEFYNATGNSALQRPICAVCAREPTVVNPQTVSQYPITDIPNPHLLAPHQSHPAHTLYNNVLLDPSGVSSTGSETTVNICQECLLDLRKNTDTPPRLSLANNLWLGPTPWQLQVLTFPEQLLIALLYPRVYVFKLFPKKACGRRNPDTLQRAMRGNVCTFELDNEGIASMVQGKLMPRQPAILASLISITYVGLGELPKNWL